ncbi:hypothetical protein HK098_001559 [Nowakowskiella sp. JEL0407]|nr:hypothetical protein HK098_001559 [Nowakowskiella sp. JEL0407]
MDWFTATQPTKSHIIHRSSPILRTSTSISSLSTTNAPQTQLTFPKLENSNIESPTASDNETDSTSFSDTNRTTLHSLTRIGQFDVDSVEPLSAEDFYERALCKCNSTFAHKGRFELSSEDYVEN